jgi:DNA end-binding protein Ku
MAPRANWKGYLRLSLVSCPIALYPASSLSEKVSFNRINRKTGNRLKQQNVDAETGEVVPRDDTVRGYEVAKGQYMIVEDEEIEAVQIESTRTIDIDRFVPKMRSMSVISTRRITLALMARLVRRLSPSFETPSRS